MEAVRGLSLQAHYFDGSRLSSTIRMILPGPQEQVKAQMLRGISRKEDADRACQGMSS